MDELIINNEKDELTILEDNKTNIHLKMVSAIEKSYTDDISSMTIMRIINNYRGYTMVLKIEKGSWVESLEKSLNYFSDIEDYLKCQEIKILIKKIVK